MSGGLDLIRVGVQIDAAGAVVSAKQITGEIERIGFQGQQAENKLRAFSTNAAFAISSMASGATQDLTSLGKSLSGLGFLASAGAGAVVLAVTSIATAMAESAKRTKEESKRMADALIDDARRINDYSRAAIEVQLAAARRQINEIVGKAPIRAVAGWDLAGKKGQRTIYETIQPSTSAEEEAKVLRLEARIRELSLALKDVAASEIKLQSDNTKKFATQLERAEDAAKKLSEYLSEGMARRFEEALGMSGSRFKDLDAMINPSDPRFGDEKFDFSVPKADLEAMAKAAGKTAEGLTKARSELKAWAQSDAGQAGMGMAAGILQRHGGIAGAIGGAGAGAIGGIAGGPAGIAYGAFTGLANAMDSAAATAHALKLRIRELQQAHEDYLEAQTDLLSNTTDLEKNIRNVRRAAAEMRASLSELYDTTYRNGQQNKDYVKAVEEITRLENERVNQLIKQQELEKTRANEDLEVRRLLALGYEEEAAAMKLAQAQQREFEDAMRDGADASTLAAMAEVHRAERIQVAMDKIKGKIAEFETTISGLEDFRNSLKLRAEQSPTARLAEAERQYGDLLEKAKGFTIPGYDGASDVVVEGDQNAARRLPAIAQTLLDLAREVYSSGEGYQDALERVMTDSGGLIEQFTDLKTIEELMLDELRTIKEHSRARETRETAPRPPARPGFGDDGNGNFSAMLSQMQAQVTVLQEGFLKTTALLETTNTKLDDVSSELRRAGEGALVGAQ